jgi:hypothetical protein
LLLIPPKGDNLRAFNTQSYVLKIKEGVSSLPPEKD